MTSISFPAHVVVILKRLVHAVSAFEISKQCIKYRGDEALATCTLARTTEAHNLTNNDAGATLSLAAGVDWRTRRLWLREKGRGYYDSIADTTSFALDKIRNQLHPTSSAYLPSPSETSGVLQCTCRCSFTIFRMKLT